MLIRLTLIKIKFKLSFSSLGKKVHLWHLLKIRQKVSERKKIEKNQEK